MDLAIILVAFVASVVIAFIAYEICKRYRSKKGATKGVDIVDNIVLISSAITSVTIIGFSAATGFADLGLVNLFYIGLAIIAAYRILVMKERIDGSYLFLLLFFNIEFYLGFLAGFFSELL